MRFIQRLLSSTLAVLFAVTLSSGPASAQSWIMLANPQVPFRDFKGLVAYIRADPERWGPVVKKAGIK